MQAFFELGQTFSTFRASQGLNFLVWIMERVFKSLFEFLLLPDMNIVCNSNFSLILLATGICRSDWHGWMGHDPDVKLPHVPGHELAGIVEEVGKNVKSFRFS